MFNPAADMLSTVKNDVRKFSVFYVQFMYLLKKFNLLFEA